MKSQETYCVGPQLPENTAQVHGAGGDEGIVPAGDLQEAVPEMEVDVQRACWGGSEVGQEGPSDLPGLAEHLPAAENSGASIAWRRAALGGMAGPGALVGSVIGWGP